MVAARAALVLPLVALALELMPVAVVLSGVLELAVLARKPLILVHPLVPYPGRRVTEPLVAALNSEGARERGSEGGM